MRIWLITVGEPLPIDEGSARLLRTGILAQILADKGHEVLWWTSTFDHFQKRQRFSRDTLVSVSDRYRLWLMHAAGYRKDVSLLRIWNHYMLGRKFRALAGNEPTPDVIVCSLPTLELSVEATAFAKKKAVPAIIDVRDMWPDIFLNLVPRWSNGLGRWMLAPMFRMARAACVDACAICGHAPAFVDWGLRYANRERTTYDTDFPFAYVTPSFDRGVITQAEEFWNDRGVIRRPGVCRICYFGGIGQVDMDGVIEAARRLQHKRDVQFVLCGSGDRLDYYRKAAQDCNNVVFPGWVQAPHIWTLMQRCSLGLAPYWNTPDLQVSIPNKAIEYMAGGLPVLTSLKQGVLHDLLADQDCGMCYDGDAHKLEEIICHLCDSPERREEMSRKALRLYEARFTASKVYDEMAEYLRGIAAACATNAVPKTEKQHDALV